MSERSGSERRRDRSIGALLSTVPAPDDVDESLWSSFSRLMFRYPADGVDLGTDSLEAFLRGMSDDDAVHLLGDEFRAERYALYVAPNAAAGRSRSRGGGAAVRAVLRRGGPTETTR